MAEDQPPRKMSIWAHLEELRLRLKWCFVTVMILFIFYGFFAAHLGTVGGVRVPYPYPDPTQPFASQFINATMNYLKPPYVRPAVFDPSAAFTLQIKVAFLLAVITGMPMISYQMGLFIAPGLRPAERRAILRLVAPSIALFLFGVAIAFFVVIPFAFSFLYEIPLRLGWETFLDPDAFLSFTLLFLLGFGLAFQLPIAMYGLTAAGLVKAATWRQYWRIAIIGIFVFGAVITPDGSGVTMLLVSVPMTGLYVGGYAASLFWERRHARGEGS